jgi:hypothetical protein
MQLEKKPTLLVRETDSDSTSTGTDVMYMRRKFEMQLPVPYFFPPIYLFSNECYFSPQNCLLKETWLEVFRPQSRESFFIN